MSLDLIIEAATKAMSMGQRIDVEAVLVKLKPMDADVGDFTIQPLKSLSGFLGLPDNQSTQQILI